jgi:putative cardiolipin synthase
MQILPCFGDKSFFAASDDKKNGVLPMKKYVLFLNSFLLLWSGFLVADEVDILPDAVTSLGKRVHMIRNTEKGERIRLSAYIFTGDDAGKVITKELGDAVKRGVKVDIMFDYQGLTIVKPSIPYLKYLVNVGATVKRVNLWLGPPISFNRRMHDKILLIENRTAIVGGRNVWDYSYDLFSKPQLDMEVVVRGKKIIKEISEYWQRRWTNSQAKPFTERLSPEDFAKVSAEIESFNKDFETRNYYEGFKNGLRQPDFRKVDRIKFVKDNRWQRLINIPQYIPGTKTWDHIEEIEVLLKSAKKEIMIESPWIVLTNRMKKALIDARSRGVKVTIFTNSASSAESPYTYHVSRAVSAKFTEKHGIEVYESNATMSLHSKFIIVDRFSTYIGSFNLGPRSERLNSETGVIFESAEESGKMAREFENRIKRTGSVKPKPFRFTDNLCMNIFRTVLSTQL